MNFIKRKKKAFTLIELLIVISIIGILTGVLYSIIDVGGVRNRARDSSLSSAADKMALSIGGFIATYGVPPNGLEFLDLVDGETVTGGCTADVNHCLFTLDGHTTRTDCSGGTCSFGYVATPTANDPDAFVILVPSFGMDDKLIGFSSIHGDIICGRPYSLPFSFITSGEPGVGQCIPAENY